MKRTITSVRSFFLMTALILATSVTGTSAQQTGKNDSSPNTLSQKEKESGWKLLFDGKTFNGWHGYNMKGIPDCWKVEDGIMKMTTVGGQESQDVVTDKNYKSFELKVEFRLTKGANSGIIYHVAENPKYKFPYETGAEYQVIDQDNWPDKLEDWQICGADYAMYPPKVRPYKPLGEWNQVHLIVNGNKVTHILNGKVVVEFEKYSPDWKKLRDSGKWKDFPDYGKFDEGRISLQNHGTHVDYRSVKIKEL